MGVGLRGRAWAAPFEVPILVGLMSSRGFCRSRRESGSRVARMPTSQSREWGTRFKECVLCGPPALLKLPKIDLTRLVMEIAKHRARSIAVRRLHGKTCAESGCIEIEFAHDGPFAAIRRGVEKERPLGLSHL
jgi:hypothetical protein